MGESIDAEKAEALLGFSEFDVAEEELGPIGGVLVVGDEGGGDEVELAAEVLEAEFGLVVEVEGVEEDEEGVGFGGGEEAGEGLVGEVDDAGGGLGLEAEKLGDEGGVGIGGGGELGG